ncbi:trypsin-like serine peptidase, partial [Nostocoides japonicum]|uniref:trypsin-like serine peptidase n=1 Tax=Nostocoides japonicum TaxID=99481 RepID=UPI00065B62B8
LAAAGIVAVGSGAAVLTTTNATAAVAPSPVVVHTVAATEAASTSSYWTAARMRSAKPADVVVSPSAAKAAVAAPRADGPAGTVAGSGTAAKATSAAAPLAAYTFVKVPVSATKKWPQRLNGKLFFTNGGTNWVCSGTSVAAASAPVQNEVWTAGHCTANTEGSKAFDTYAQFIPAYNGKGKTEKQIAPFGRFTATQYITTTAWLNNGDLSVDLGAIRVGTNAKGQTLGQAVGWDGFAWNQSYQQQFNAFGYPAAAPYNGQSMYRDRASTSSTANVGGVGPVTLGIPNPMTGGSSGGEWAIQWNANQGASGYINGHNDFKFTNDPLTMYSPYFNSLANTVRCFGASSC